MFLDPTGRRWRTTRIIGITALIAVVVSLTYAIPNMWSVPTQAGQTNGQLGAPLSKRDTGPHPPVVGQGPLIRVLQVREANGQKAGVDPFTGERLANLTGADSAKAGQAPYVIQRFGYSAAATKTISMTFDDGPDPKVTPELLNVLSANKAPATFFVVGQNAASHPEIVDRIVREGHAVGVHTLTHADVADEPVWREHVELVATDRVLRAITNQQSDFWRMPYEGGDEGSLQETIDGALRAQRLGYTFASHDFDTDDWHHDADPGGRVEDIPLPNLDGNKNITMLMHDAGGPNRMRTVQYVKKLIPYARAHGYTFQTMPQVQPVLAPNVQPIQPTIWDRTTLHAVQAVYVWPNMLLSALFVFALLAVVLVGFGNALLAWLGDRRRRRVTFPARDAIDLPTSVVLAAFNEEPVIARTLRSILNSDYPILEVIVVDDGSTDATADQVRMIMAQDPRVLLLRQGNTGKAAALNYGVLRAKGDFVITLDADTIIPPGTVTKLMRHFALDDADRLGAVAGVVRVGNRETNLLTRWQALEYLTQIGVERAAQDALGAISIIPGACAAWRKRAILEAGGYSDITLAEDCDLALTLHHLRWTVTQDNQALAYTEAPQTVDDLLAQRTRWTFGTLQAIWKHRSMLFRRKYGALGCFVMPNYVLSVVMPVIFLPFVLVMCWLAIQQQGWGVLVAYFMLFLLAHLVVAAVAVKLMGEKRQHLMMVPIYRLVYEPLRAYLLYTSVFLAIKGGRMGWNKLVRTGSMDSAMVSAMDSIIDSLINPRKTSADPEETTLPDRPADVLVSQESSPLTTPGTRS